MQSEREYYLQFVQQLKNFVTELDNAYSTSGTKKFLERFDFLNMDKTMARFLRDVVPNKDKIQNRDTSLFDNKFSFVPGVNLSKIWNYLNEETKNRAWTYLQMLFIYAELVVDKEVQTDVKDMYNSVESFFNPFEGVGENNANLSINDLLTGELPQEQENNSSSMFNPMMLAQMAGLSGNMDMGKFSEYLGNISKDDIDSAKDSIKQLLGNREDNTSKMLMNMLDSISTELTSSDISQGNVFENITKIAEKVSKNLKDDAINMNDLLKTAQELSKQSMNSTDIMNSLSNMQLDENIMKELDKFMKK